MSTRRHSPGPLSPREEQVMVLLSEGLRNAEIARTLCVSVGTVKNHRQGACIALDARTSSQAMYRWAARDRR